MVTFNRLWRNAILIIPIVLVSCQKAPVIEVTQVSLNKTELSLTLGESFSLKASVSPSEASDTTIIWRSSNYNVISIKGGGNITAVGGGQATVKAIASNGTFAECVVTVTVPVSEIILDRTIIEMGVDETLTVSASVLPEEATDKGLSWLSANSAIVSVDNEGHLYGVSEGVTSIYVSSSNGIQTNFKVYVNKVIDSHYYIDLGLSVKWAILNVGANYRSDLGDLFAWGETEPWRPPYKYKYYDEETHKYTKYIVGIDQYGEIDHKNVLDSIDDAVCVNWGKGWRMPTAQEYQELITNCNVSWTEVDGVGGVLFESQIDGYSDRALFFPAAGNIRGGYQERRGGYYWSKTLSYYPTRAYYIWFSRGTLGGYNLLSDTDRTSGFSIRGVIELEPNTSK